MLRLLKYSEGARQIERDASHAVWFSRDTEDNAYYLAMFNFTEEQQRLGMEIKTLGIDETEKIEKAEELWNGEELPITGGKINAEAGRHGAVLLKLMPADA